MKNLDTLLCGIGFLGIYPLPATATASRIDHLCLGMENFDADAVLKQLTERGVKGNIRLRGTGLLGDKDP